MDGDRPAPTATAYCCVTRPDELLDIYSRRVVGTRSIDANQNAALVTNALVMAADHRPKP